MLWLMVYFLERLSFFPYKFVSSSSLRALSISFSQFWVFFSFKFYSHDIPLGKVILQSMFEVFHPSLISSIMLTINCKHQSEVLAILEIEVSGLGCSSNAAGLHSWTIFGAISKIPLFLKETKVR